MLRPYTETPASMPSGRSPCVLFCFFGVSCGVRLDIYGFEGADCEEWHGEHAFTIRALSIM